MVHMLSLESSLFYMLYGGVIFLAFFATCYLLLRHGNAFTTDITPPMRLRRWTAAFFVTIIMSHVWWLFICFAQLYSDPLINFLICAFLDVVITMPVLLCIMVVMLQDRRRPLWPILIIVALYLVDLLLAYLLDARESMIPIVLSFIIIIGITIAIVRAVRQYERWLLDNYADLEHKEVRQCFFVIAAFLLTSIAYALSNNSLLFQTLIEVFDILLIIVLLWRVETLQTLEELTDDAAIIPDNVDYAPVGTEDTSDGAEGAPADSEHLFEKLNSLLQQRCVDTGYYLRHDASQLQLAQLLETNRNDLSQYFAQQGLTYNTYINGLRIQHFIHLYQEAAKTQQDISVTELADKSGFSSYRTFARDFKQIMGRSVTEWVLAQ